ncbi:flagellin [Halobacterium bonnevillei]|uniref:Flagellin n=1 Tax=Halobacterium bonnevillei TaxID=2692200 RepID=A0A6B0SC10_9EURY|nr:flagellin [Halobacterium bonnevillei]MXR19194.1 flagellin [Halobacterium bonnevillei]
MASVSSAHLVLFIAAILVSAAVAGTVTESASRVGSAVEADSDLESQRVDADVRIVSDADSPTAVYDDSSETLTLYVKNVGGRTLPSKPDDVPVLVNGNYQSDVQTTVLDGDAWRPGTLLELSVNVTLADGAETRVVVTPTGARDLFVFTTPG